MKVLTTIILSGVIFTACTKEVYVPVEKRVEVKETVRDTIVPIHVEPERIEVYAPDTVSIVETRYAKATAQWHGGRGILEHRIENKPDTLNVPVRYVVREKEIEKPAPYPVEVEVPVDRPVRMPLRWWEEALVWLGAATIGYGVFRVFRLFRR